MFSFRLPWAIAAGFTLSVIARVSAQFLPTGAGPYDYMLPQNWTNSLINGVFAQQLETDQAVGFFADTTLSTGLTFRFAGHDETLLGLGADRILTLGGDIIFQSPSEDRTLTIGSPANGNKLAVNFGSTSSRLNVGAGNTLVFLNSVQRSSSWLKVGRGMLLFAGPATFGGAYVSVGLWGGTVILDHRSDNGVKLDPRGPLSLISSTLRIIGSSDSPTSEAVNYLLPQDGASNVIVENSGSSPVSFQTGNMTKNGNLGGTVDFSRPTVGAIYTTAQNTRGILGNYVTVEGSSWATRDTSGRIVPLSTFVNTVAPNANVDVLADTNVNSSATVSTLRFNSAAANVSIAPSTTCTVDGVLLTPNLNGAPITITGGTLAAMNAELIIHNYNLNGTLEIDSGITAPFGLTVSGAGNLVLRGTNSHHWATTINGGTVDAIADTNLGSSFDADLVLNGGTLRLGGSFTLAGNRRIKLGVDGGTIDTNGFDLTFSGTGTIFGEGGLTKKGDGTFYMRNNSAYTGATRIANGTLVIKAAGLGTIDSGTVVESGATLAFESALYNLAEPLTLNGEGVGGAGALRSLFGSSSFAGPITLTSDARVGVDSGRLDLLARIDGDAHLTKGGAGILNLAAANSYRGGTTVDAGVLILSNNNSLGTEPNCPAVTLVVNGGSIQTTAAVTLGPNCSVWLGETDAANFGANSGTFTVSGKVTGPGALIRQNPINLAPFVLTNPANDYSGGTVVDAGVVQFNAPGAIGGSGANILINLTGIVATGYPLDQAFLQRLDSRSGGTVALNSDSNADLDFGADEVFLAAIGNCAYGGHLSSASGPFRLGGAGGTLTLTRAHALADAAAVTIGRTGTPADTIVLANDNSVDTITLGGGTLRVTGATLNSTSIDVGAGTTFVLDSGNVNASRIEVHPGGVLRACGTITAELVNNGTVLLDCDAIINGAVTNNGTLVVYSDTAQFGTSLINNGTLDLLTAPHAVLPVDFVNVGTVIDASSSVIESIMRIGGAMRLNIRMIPNHTYVLQRSLVPDAADPGWINISSALSVISPVTIPFNDFPGSNAAFYRVQISP